MKKILVLLLALAMSMAMFTACGANGDTDAGDTGAEVNGLTAAKNYLYTMYKDSAEVTPSDFTRVGVVKINGVTYTVEWTASSETVTIIPGDDKMVTIDVDEANPEEVTFTLTATLKDETGAAESVSFTHRVPAAIIIDEGMTYEQIVDAAYALEDGIALEETFRLFGTIVKIDTPYSEDYQNITVTIQIGDMSDKLIMCYRLKGEGANALAVGDAITVEGILKNYKGTIEFDAGCVLVGMGEVVDQTALLDAAYALEDGIAMTDSCTMTGVISKIDTAYSADYQNITVTMVVGGDAERPIMCYRLKGEGAADLAIGDTITVTGILKNYKGTIEFDAGCTLDAVIKGAASEETGEDSEPVDRFADLDMNDAAAVVNAAYTLESGESMVNAATLTGVITSIDTEYSEQYGNITVTIQVGDMADKLINCYRLKGEGADALAVGDTITVTGTLTNYNGKVQFGAGCTLSVAGNGETAGAADLAAYFESFMLSLGEDNTPFMMPADAEVIDAYYAGLTAIATKQCEVQLAAMSAVAFEFALIECENAADVEAVKAILEARKAYQVDGGAWYPETCANWEKAEIVVNGNFVALILAGDQTADAVAAFNALFA